MRIKDVAKEFVQTGKDIGDETTTVGLTVLTGLANIFGAGSAVEELVRKANKGLIPRSEEVSTAITQDLSKIKGLSEAKLYKLQQLLNSSQIYKSNIQREAIDKFNDKIKNEIARKQAELGLADDLYNTALSQASSIDYATTGQKRKIATKAYKTAEMAKQAYEKLGGDENSLDSIEQKI